VEPAISRACRCASRPTRISYPTLLRACWRNVGSPHGAASLMDRGAFYRRHLHPRHTSAGAGLASLQARARELDQSSRDRVQIRPAQASSGQPRPITRTTPPKTSSNTTIYRWLPDAYQRLNSDLGLKSSNLCWPWTEQKSEGYPGLNQPLMQRRIMKSLSWATGSQVSGLSSPGLRQGLSHLGGWKEVSECITDDSGMVLGDSGTSVPFASPKHADR